MYNKIFFSLFFLSLLINNNNVYAFETFNNRNNLNNKPSYNINNNYIMNSTQSKFEDLNAIEKYLLNKTYNRENLLSRIERLEMNTFGALQIGNLDTRYENVRNTILAHPKANYKTSFFRSMQDYFLGQMTGYTPQMQNNPYYNYKQTQYPSKFANQNRIEYSGPNGHGYRTNNYDTGNYSRVTILD